MALARDWGLVGDYSSSPPPPGAPHTTDSTFDSNLVVILAALLCILICALGLNSIFRCALRCSRRMVFESANDAAVRLANTGLNVKAIKALPSVVYSLAIVPCLPAEVSTECPICLSEFAQGEELTILPNCNHGFHVGCIQTWLSSHSSCPTCRRCLAGVYKSDSIAVGIVVEQPRPGSSS